MDFKDILLSIAIVIALISIVILAQIGIDTIREASQAFILDIYKLLLKGDI